MGDKLRDGNILKEAKKKYKVALEIAEDLPDSEEKKVIIKKIKDNLDSLKQEKS